MFAVASALGQFLNSDGTTARLRSGREASGVLLTMARARLVREVLNIGPRRWRALVSEWEARYVAHRCGRGRVVLFTRPLLEICPGCTAPIPLGAPPPSIRRRGDTTRALEAVVLVPESGRNTATPEVEPVPLSGTDAPHTQARSIEGIEKTSTDPQRIGRGADKLTAHLRALEHLAAERRREGRGPAAWLSGPVGEEP